MRKIWLAAAAAALLTMGAAQAQEKVVKVYNWSDYIDPDVLTDFTEKTGIKVIYDVYDSNEVLETKLLAGNTGYDLVVPTAYFLARQIQAGIFQPLDKAKIPNWSGLDPKLMAQAAQFDPGNDHAMIYMWGTTGLAYNVDKIKERMPDAPLDSWAHAVRPGGRRRSSPIAASWCWIPADDVLPSALQLSGRGPEQQGSQGAGEGCRGACRRSGPTSASSTARKTSTRWPTATSAWR